MGLGTIINISTILIGSILGLAIGSRFKENTRELLMMVLGFVCLLNAADSIKSLWSSDLISALPKGWPLLVILVSLLLGALIGLGLKILGSISDGMRTGISQLVLKSILDGLGAIAFAASLGWGVALSAIPVGIYQFSWTAIGAVLGSVLPSYQIAAMTTTGGILLLGIAFRLIKIKQVPVGNLLPALFLAPIIAGVVHIFN